MNAAEVAFQTLTEYFFKEMLAIKSETNRFWDGMASDL